MGYGLNEHTYNVTRLQQQARAIDTARETVSAVRADCLEDAPVETAEARGHLRAASIYLETALTELDKAVAMLPTPAVTESDLAQVERELGYPS